MSTEAAYETGNDAILAAAAEPLRAALLLEARRLTCTDRHAIYGPPVGNHAHIAAIFNAITGRDLTAREAALFQVATKLARLSRATGHRDSYVDAMAYLGIAAECAAAEDG